MLSSSSMDILFVLECLSTWLVDNHEVTYEFNYNGWPK